MGPNLTFNTVYTLNILLNYVNIEHMGKKLRLASSSFSSSEMEDSK